MGALCPMGPMGPRKAMASMVTMVQIQDRGWRGCRGGVEKLGVMVSRQIDVAHMHGAPMYIKWWGVGKKV